MAEEVVVREPLTSEMIHAGRELLVALDEQGSSPVLCAWFFVSEAHEWRLLLAFPGDQALDRRSCYERVQRILQERGETLADLNLRNITILRSEDSVARLLHFMIHTGPGIHGLRFTGNRFNNVLVEDAYIYRSV